MTVWCVPQSDITPQCCVTYHHRCSWGKWVSDWYLPLSLVVSTTETLPTSHSTPIRGDDSEQEFKEAIII